MSTLKVTTDAITLKSSNNNKNGSLNYKKTG